MKIEFEPIGYFKTPYKTKENMPIQPPREEECEIIIEERFREGLKDLEGFSRIILIFNFHKSEGFELHTKPFLDDERRGVFAVRAPRRPNPIGLSIARLLGISGGTLKIEGADVLDGTPLLDIKPYIPRIDSFPDSEIGWLAGKSRRFGSARSDDRFG